MNKNKSGFTLVEIMIAVVMFGMVSIYGLSFFSFAGKNKVSAGEVTFALQLAKDKMEEIKTMPYNNIPALRQDMPDILSPAGITYRRYYGSSEIIERDERYKVVYVTVTWNRSLNPIALHTIVIPKQ